MLEGRGFPLPTLQDVRSALTEMLFGDQLLDTVTVTFAGHGAVSGGGFSWQ